MTKNDNIAQFCPEAYYHVYSRTNNREILFTNDDERSFFLKKYKEYLSDYVDTFAWCLMGNHFHLCIRVKPESLILAKISGLNDLNLTAAHRRFIESPKHERTFHSVVEAQFSRLFTSYAMKFNLLHHRSGNLFYRPFKRIKIKDESHLQWLVYYIHSNIAKHGIRPDFAAYHWSSYATFFNEKPTLVCRQEVLGLFGGKANFLEFHGYGHRKLADDMSYIEIE